MHIFRLGATGTDDAGRQYQINYVNGGNNFVRIVDDETLEEFLKTKVALESPVVNQALSELSDRGSTTIPEVNIPEEEALTLGLEQLPSDA